jgi:uncharacterized protein (DUF697 family)
MIPVVGSVLGLVTTPMVASASTYALGKIFIQHFESGGTFLDFDPSKVKTHFSQQFEKGKTIVSEKKTEKKTDKKPDKKDESEPLPATT